MQNWPNVFIFALQTPEITPTTIETPQHKRAFLQLCADGYWSQWAFNRVSS
jgi:cyclophilin family peptidyl-prolyl cis-trans isomerase